MDAAQAFMNANAATQLAVLPHFFNKNTDDQFIPAQWSMVTEGDQSQRHSTMD